MTKRMVTFIDPPSGWRYGFPRALPNPAPENVIEWLISNGYPKKEVDKLGDSFYCRYWSDEEDDEQKNAAIS